MDDDIQGEKVEESFEGRSRSFVFVAPVHGRASVAIDMGNGEPQVIAGPQPISIRLRGWLFAAMMLFSAVFGCIYIITPLLPLLVWNPKLWRRVMDRLIGIWVVMPGALMSYMFGAHVKVKGHAIDHNEPAIIIMNHRTRLDWLFFWNALFKINPWLCTTEKISLKGILKYVPGAGWAMGCGAFLFLDRSFDTDKTKLDSMLDYYASVGCNYQLLLFPEGTDKCPKATERSRIHAEKKGLVHYDYLLHTRTTGFVHIVQNMRRANYCKWIYDVTIGFGDCIVQSEIGLISHGVCPRDVQYQIEKIAVDSLPKDDAGLSNWLVTRWRDKEEKLRAFYAMDAEERHFDLPEGGRDFELDDNNAYVQLLIVIFWFVTTFIWIMGFFTIPIMFYFSILAIIIFSVITKVYGGVEWLAIAKFNERRMAEVELASPRQRARIFQSGGE